MNLLEYSVAKDQKTREQRGFRHRLLAFVFKFDW